MFQDGPLPPLRHDLSFRNSSPPLASSSSSSLPFPEGGGPPRSQTAPDLSRSAPPPSLQATQSSNDKTIRVQLSLHATRLRTVAGLGGNADPFAVVTRLDHTKKPVQLLGETETIYNTLSPSWTRVFYLDYKLDKETFFNVGVWDGRQKKKNNQKGPMGSAMFEVGSVLGARGNIKSKNLKRGGTVFCHVERAASQSSGELVLRLRGVKLRNVERFSALGSKSDPFFELSRKFDGPGGCTWRAVLRSPHLSNNLNPTWEEVRTNLDILCEGQVKNPILISVFDYQSKGSHVKIGDFETTVQGLLNAAAATADAAQRAASGARAAVVDTHRWFVLKDKRGRPAGQIVVLEAHVDTSGTAAAGGAGGAGAPTLPTTTLAAAAAASNSGAGPNSSSVEASGLTSSTNTTTTTSSFASPRPPQPPAPATSPSASMPPPPPPATSPSASMPPATTSLPHQPPSPQRSGRPSVISIPASPPPPLAEPSRSGPSDLFVDYLTGGLQLRLCFAIDLTGSNGDPREPGTLHYVDEEGYELNDYERAIVEVGSIVAKYDHDQQFPVWGFGAKYDDILRHCFQIGPTAEATGVEGVLQYYRSVFDTPMCMSGPTVFDEVIMTAASQAASAHEAALTRGELSYTILVILSDGAVGDLNACRETIRDVSGTPLSIIIVGIGKDDFSAMQELRFCDEHCRDIVQFVEFDAYRHDASKLRQATLEEIPSQVVTYFQQEGIDPQKVPGGFKNDAVTAEEHDEAFDLDLNVMFGGEGGEIMSLGEGPPLMIPTSIPASPR